MKPFRMQQLTELVDHVLTDTAALCAPRPRDNPSLPARSLTARIQRRVRDPDEIASLRSQ